MGSVIEINGKPGPTGAGNAHMAQRSTRTFTTPDTHPLAPPSVVTDIGTQHAPEKIYGKQTLLGRIFATGNGTKMRQRPAGTPNSGVGVAKR